MLNGIIFYYIDAPVLHCSIVPAHFLVLRNTLSKFQAANLNHFKNQFVLLVLKYFYLTYALLILNEARIFVVMDLWKIKSFFF